MLKSKLFTKQALLGFLLITLGITLKYFGITDYCSLRSLNSNFSLLQVFIQNHYFLSVILFISAFFLATSIAIPGSSFFLTAAGLLFGIIPGVIYCVIGGTLGATVLFLISRYVIGHAVQRRYQNALMRFNEELDYYGYIYLLLCRFMAMIPFFVINLLSGITLIPTTTFMWTTAVGMIPSALVFGYAGKQLSYVESFETIFCPSVIVAFGILIGFKIVLVPIVYRFYKKRRA